MYDKHVNSVQATSHMSIRMQDTSACGDSPTRKCEGTLYSPHGAAAKPHTAA